MDKETFRMQMLSGVITEGQYKAKLNKIEAKEKKSLNEHIVGGGIVGIGAINQIPSRAKADYEDAFEHFLSEKYEVKPNRERDDIKDIKEEEKLDENYEPNKMLKLIEMYVDNHFDEGMSAEAAIKKIDELLQGNLDDSDKEFMAGEED